MIRNRPSNSERSGATAAENGGGLLNFSCRLSGTHPASVSNETAWNRIDTDKTEMAVFSGREHCRHVRLQAWLVQNEPETMPTVPTAPAGECRTSAVEIPRLITHAAFVDKAWKAGGRLGTAPQFAIRRVRLQWASGSIRHRRLTAAVPISASFLQNEAKCMLQHGSAPIGAASLVITMRAETRGCVGARRKGPGTSCGGLIGNSGQNSRSFSSNDRNSRGAAGNAGRADPARRLG